MVSEDEFMEITLLRSLIYLQMDMSSFLPTKVMMNTFKIITIMME